MKLGDDYLMGKWVGSQLHCPAENGLQAIIGKPNQFHKLTAVFENCSH